MAYDPLNRSTRVARTTFMIVGATSVAVSIFHVKLTTIDGFDVPFPETTMTAVLIVATIYTFVAFLVAYRDDTLYIIAPESEKENIKNTPLEIEEINHLKRKVSGGVPTPAGIRSHFDNYNKYLKEMGYADHFARMINNNKEIENIWESLKPQLIASCELSIITKQQYLVSRGRSRFSELRLKYFDLYIPVILFVLAALGWLGLLDWIAPLIEASATGRSP